MVWLPWVMALAAAVLLVAACLWLSERHHAASVVTEAEQVVKGANSDS